MKYLKLFNTNEKKLEFEQTIYYCPIVVLTDIEQETEISLDYYDKDDIVSSDTGNNDSGSNINKTVNNIILRPYIGSESVLSIDYICDYLVESDIELELSIPGINFTEHVPFFKASTFITGTKIDMALGASSNNISVLNITPQEDSYYYYNFIVRPTVEFTFNGKTYTVDYGTTWSKFLGYSILGVYDENGNCQYGVDNVFIVEGIYMPLYGDSGGSND